MYFLIFVDIYNTKRLIMIQNKFIVNKRVIEKIVGEYIAVIYLLDKDGRKKEAIKPNFETKMYILDKTANYHILRCKTLF